MKKSLLKFIAGGIGLVVIAVGVLYLVNYIRYRTSPEYRAEQYFKDLERRYREDAYGGNTPEETLQMFIDALKRGDIELASKYFVLEKQEKWRWDLARIKERGLLKFTISDLENLKLTKQTQDEVFYTLADEKKDVIVEMILSKNINGKWKILEL